MRDICLLQLSAADSKFETRGAEPQTIVQRDCCATNAPVRFRNGRSLLGVFQRLTRNDPDVGAIEAGVDRRMGILEERLSGFLSP